MLVEDADLFQRLFVRRLPAEQRSQKLLPVGLPSWTCLTRQTHTHTHTHDAFARKQKDSNILIVVVGVESLARPPLFNTSLALPKDDDEDGKRAPRLKFPSLSPSSLILSQMRSVAVRLRGPARGTLATPLRKWVGDPLQRLPG